MESPIKINHTAALWALVLLLTAATAYTGYQNYKIERLLSGASAHPAYPAYPSNATSSPPKAPQAPGVIVGSDVSFMLGTVSKIAGSDLYFTTTSGTAEHAVVSSGTEVLAGDKAKDQATYLAEQQAQDKTLQALYEDPQTNKDAIERFLYPPFYTTQPLALSALKAGDYVQVAMWGPDTSGAYHALRVARVDASLFPTLAQPKQ
jgi:hypothetical protein